MFMNRCPESFNIMGGGGGGHVPILSRGHLRRLSNVESHVEYLPRANIMEIPFCLYYKYAD